jgi:hypothetical protein
MRWDEQRVEAERERPLPGLAVEAVRTFDVPEALGIRFHEVRAKSALNHVPSAPFGFNWTINLYRGCTHACTYCFARRTHRYLDLDAGRDFEREIVVKVNAPEVLRAELARRSWKRDLVAIGTNTDPYQWCEGRYKLMPPVLEALRDSDTPVSVLTKSPLVLRDLDRYVEMAGRAGASVNLSVPTLDEKDPGAARRRRRAQGSASRRCPPPCPGASRARRSRSSARALPSPSPCACPARRGRRAAWPSLLRSCAATCRPRRYRWSGASARRSSCASPAPPAAFAAR